MDPPLHFLADAAPVPEMDVNVLCGPCRVLDLSNLAAHVDADDLAPAAGAERVLLKTRNSFRDASRFHEDFLALTLPAARWLVERGVRLIGVDGPSIEPFHSEDHPVHRAVLEAGIAVVEGLDLRTIEPGAYELICAPLLWRGGDGSPCRALLRPLP